MDFRILGSLQVCEGTRELAVGGGKQRSLLARLLVEANRPVPEDVLIEALWPEQPPARPAENLHVLVSRLRRALGANRIVREAGGYAIRLEAGELDLARFQRLRGEGRLDDALALWTGRPLADFTYEEWAQSEIRRLEELRLSTLEQRFETDLVAGRHQEIAGELQAAVAEFPLRENLRRQLIIALYGSGRQAEALEVYRETRRMLDEELGLEPSPALRELEVAVLRHDPSLQRPSRPPAAARPQRRGRAVLAATATAFAGFGAAVAAIELLRTDEPRRVAAAATRAPERPTTGPTSTTRVVILRQRAAVSLPAPRQKPAKRPTSPPPPPPATVSPPPAPPSPPPPTPRRQRQKQVRPKPKAKPRPKPAAAPIRISDDFDDGMLDRGTWVRSTSTGVVVEERNGRLEIAVAPEALAEGDYKLISGTYGTSCRFLRDFDAKVEFELLEWPEANGAVVQLAAWFNSFNAGAIRQSQTWAEEYGSWMTRNARHSPSNDVRGALRVRRVGDRITTYYRRGREWYPIQTASGFVGAPIIGLQLMSNDEWFADKPVRVAFDNFSLVTDARAC